MKDFDKEVRVKINDTLQNQLDFIKEKENQPSNASMVRQLIQDRYNELMTTKNDLVDQEEAATA